MSGGDYLALAYLAVFLAVLVYLAIIAAKLVRLQREVDEVTELVRERALRAEAERETTSVG